MNVLEEWVKVAAGELGLDPADVRQRLVLDVARDVAHNVVRPGAPVTAYLMGLAVGRGAEPADVARRITDLALQWPDRDAAAHGTAGQSAEAQAAEAQAAAGERAAGQGAAAGQRDAGHGDARHGDARQGDAGRGDAGQGDAGATGARQ